MLLAGCGGGDGARLRAADAQPLIALAHRIAQEGPCAQAGDVARLHARAIALVNARKVPAELQEPLMSGVGALQPPVCLPSVPPAATTPAPAATPTPSPAAPAPPGEHGHGHGNGHGKHHGHGKDD